MYQKPFIGRSTHGPVPPDPPAGVERGDPKTGKGNTREKREWREEKGGEMDKFPYEHFFPLPALY